ncbi:cupredoxin domain-containing protein [Rhodotorula paludigena]|uniref:cupredoxin domain-containing protein n=1 Tax=Rhodotorula paludigena TaxID=86838 RepID=UPI00316D73B4
MKLSTAFASLALLAPLVLALDRHSPASLGKRRLAHWARSHETDSYGSVDSSSGDYGGSSDGWDAAATDENDDSGDWARDDQASAAPVDYSADSWASAGAPTETAVAAQPYDTANWAPTETAATGDGGWGSGAGSPYDACIQQCMASSGLGWPAATATDAVANPSASAPSPTETGQAGAPAAPPANDTGLVAGPLQVVVAPKKGDLRMVPFNIAAKKGETIEFVWGAGPHTVTQSSAAAICNASLEDGAFKSGMQNASFKFEVPVESEETIFYYCAVAMHCKNGMFGLINVRSPVVIPKVDLEADLLLGFAYRDKKNQDMWDATVKITADFPDAASWGDNLSTEQFEDWALPYAMESTLMTRQYFAQKAVEANSTATPSASSGDSAPNSSESGSSAAATTAAAKSSNGAAVVARPGMTFGTLALTLVAVLVVQAS